MTPPVDTSVFQTNAGWDDEDRADAEKLWELARAYASTRGWADIVSDILLAFAFADKLGVFLVRFSEDLPVSRGAAPGERERWMVVGDVPSMNFETEGFAAPDLALELYCQLAQDWAEAVLDGGDLDDCYPITAAPTEQHARMLLSRVEFFRDNIVPECRAKCSVPADRRGR